MTECISNIDSSWSISDYADLANIVIAFFNLGLAFYIFVYQRNKDNKDKQLLSKREQVNKIEALNIQEQNIRLQWFKELIIQPHINEINIFYSKLHSLEKSLTRDIVTEEEKIKIITFIKFEQSKLRKAFGDILINVNLQLYIDIKINLDSLIDLITERIFDDNLPLNKGSNFEKHIGSVISYSHNDLISKIFNYKGN